MTLPKMKQDVQKTDPFQTTNNAAKHDDKAGGSATVPIQAVNRDNANDHNTSQTSSSLNLIKLQDIY
jgi:hypothetical protein